MNLSIKMDVDDLRRAFDRSPVIVTTRLQEWVVRGSFRAERESKLQLRSQVSSATSGQTLSSIRTTTGLLTAETKANTDYAKYTITGRKPGRMPPFGNGSDLANWSRRAGIDPFLVARAIGRKGTKGIPYMEDAYNIIKKEVDRDADKTVDSIIKDLL